MTSIDKSSRSVRVDNVKTVKYKKLCICTGASPRVIDSEHPHILSIRDTQTVIQVILASDWLTQKIPTSDWLIVFSFKRDSERQAE